MILTATIILVAYLKVSFPLFSIILPSTEGETVLASNVTIDCKCDGSCPMIEAKSVSAAVGDSRYSEESMTSLCLCL